MTQVTDKHGQRHNSVQTTNIEELPAATPDKSSENSPSNTRDDTAAPSAPREVGGQKGPEPTRYGDWEKNGRCTDF